MAWSNDKKPKYKYNDKDYEIGVHVKGDAGNLEYIGEDGLVKVCIAGSTDGIEVVLQTARTERDGLLGKGFKAHLRSPNPEIYNEYSDVTEQQTPKSLRKL